MATTTTPADSVNLTNKPEVLAAIREASECKRIEAAGAEAKKRRTTLEETVIRPALGSARFGIVRGVRAVVLSNPQSNSHNDAAILKGGWPEAYAASLVTTPYTYLKYNLG